MAAVRDWLRACICENIKLQERPKKQEKNRTKEEEKGKKPGAGSRVATRL
jgi:hypothetical protein